jgi:hypothetical protein
MYKLKPANAVPVRASALRIGLPVYEHTFPNIALVSSNNMDPIHLNAVVLRQALLNSPEEVKHLLGLQVIDLKNQTPEPVQTSTIPTEEPKPKIEKQTKSKQTSKESKEVEVWV